MVAKTQDSRVRGKALYYSWQNKQQEHQHVCMNPSFFQASQGNTTGPDRGYTHSQVALWLRYIGIGASTYLIASSKEAYCLSSERESTPSPKVAALNTPE